MNLNPTLKNAVNTLNTKWKDCGSVEAITWDEYVKREYSDQFDRSYNDFLASRNIRMNNTDGIFHPKGDVIVINYDFCIDELSEEDGEKFLEDFGRLRSGMQLQSNPLCDYDGSGEGLYYGIALFG